MFINPKHAIDQGWVKFPTWMTAEEKYKCIQPNALDFTVDGLHAYPLPTHPTQAHEFIISETFKQMRPLQRLEPWSVKNDSQDRFWTLQGSSYYDITSDFYVDLPVGVAAYVVTRSTFVRNGLFLMTGLWDSGFKGHLGAVLHNRGYDAYVAPGTRIGQIIFVKSETSDVMYAGGYNHAVGTHYTTTKGEAQ